ncbi:unnamed protein product [Cuscuta campestris]|uniref:Uncharacterized protein n=1 Tax=Cuscuta campestris TaxID=132261 RepID=A0A484KET5_9ASTE|nr:unnamed protein product [Cuscuta campestris]
MVIEVEANYIATLVRDACVTALYARLRPIHRALPDYSQRFETPSLYIEEMELPLPFVEAIQNFGPFNPTSIPQNYLCVPVYPENTLNEGRTAAQWSSLEYEATIPGMKEIGIPFKSVDTGVKSGTAWWCMHYERHGNSHDIVCLYPPINYSDHSVLLQEWPARFIDVPLSYPLRVFAALCHAPPAEWNEFVLMSEPQ